MPKTSPNNSKLIGDIHRFVDYKRISRELLRLRLRYIDDKRFLLLLSFGLGIETGLIVVILKSVVYFIKDTLESEWVAGIANYVNFLLPLLGVGLTILSIRLFAGGKLDRGVPSVLYAIGRNSSHIKKSNMYMQSVASAITVGFGGSVGLEAPVVVTGAAWGSFYGRVFRMNRQQTTILIGCGVAAAIAAIFNAPIAGVLFVLEVLLPNLNITFFIPILIASATGMLMSKLFMGEDVLFHFTIVDKVQNMEMPFFVLLGVLAGLLSVAFLKVIEKVQQKIESIESQGKRLAFGGVSLGLLILLFPTLYGEGYWSLSLIIKGQFSSLTANNLLGEIAQEHWFIITFLFFSMALKVVATGITRAAGGHGGIFAPAMFTGGLAGFLFAHILNLISPDLGLSETNFTLVGMAGVSSGILHSPLTKIFLIAEITKGYELFVPLMIVSAIAFAIKLAFSPYSFYTKELAKTGDYIVHDHDRSLLHHIKVSQVIERDFISVPIDGKLRDIAQMVTKSHRSIFPVVDDIGQLHGIISFNDIRELIFDPSQYDEKEVRFLMRKPLDTIAMDEPMEKVMDKFDSSGVWNLPVVHHGLYRGFVSKSRILSIYREELRKVSKGF